MDIPVTGAILTSEGPLLFLASGGRGNVNVRSLSSGARTDRGDIAKSANSDNTNVPRYPEMKSRLVRYWGLDEVSAIPKLNVRAYAKLSPNSIPIAIGA